MKVLLVDDEEPARSRLALLLRAFEDIEIIGEAADGEEAMEKILELRPDLVFLDIQMPGCSGVEVAQSLPSPRPKVIFCTAYDHYAIEAFELNAVDYLLKPVNRARLEQAVDRARQLPPQELDVRLEKAAQAVQAAPARFLARWGSRFRVIPQQDVLYFSSEEGLTKLCTEHQHYWMQPTLSELENRLSPTSFCRISRSAIVNLDHVLEVLPLMGGYAQVVLKNKARLDVSRRRLRELLSKLGE